VGTGKSSIAHEVARLFDKKCLGSYAAFWRKEQSKDEAYHLFTALSRDLSYRYPHAPGKVVIGKMSLCSIRDYPRRFEWPLLKPLMAHNSTAQFLSSMPWWNHNPKTQTSHTSCSMSHRHPAELPCTHHLETGEWYLTCIRQCESRPYPLSYVDDAELAANTEQDIGLYFRHELPRDVFKYHGDNEVKASEVSMGGHCTRIQQRPC
jgi:hypothetical protein